MQTIDTGDILMKEIYPQYFYLHSLKLSYSGDVQHDISGLQA